MLNLKWGLSFEDLYRREGLLRLDAVFLEHLKASDVLLFNRLMEARATEPSREAQSDLIVDLAPYVEDFVARVVAILSGKSAHFRRAIMRSSRCTRSSGNSSSKKPSAA